MKNLFLYLPILLSITPLSLTVYPMEIAQVTGKTQIGHGIYEWTFEWTAEASQQDRQFMEKQLAAQGQENFIIPSLQCQEESTPAAQISPDGKLLFLQPKNKVVIKNRYGKIQLHPKCSPQFVDGSLDEENINKKASGLRSGDNVELSLGDGLKIHVTYHSTVKLISTNSDDTPSTPSSLPRDNSSANTTIILEREDNEGKMPEILVHKLLFSRQGCSASSLTWSKDSKIVRITSEKIQPFAINNSQEIIDLETEKPIDLKDIFKNFWLENFWIEQIKLSPNSSKAIINIRPLNPDGKSLDSNNGTTVIIDLKTKKIIYDLPDVLIKVFQYRTQSRIDYCVEFINQDGSKIWSMDPDHKVEIIDLETKKTIFKRSNIHRMKFSPDFKNILIQYSVNGKLKEEIINLERKEVNSYKTVSPHQIEFSKDSTMALIVDCYNKGWILDLKTMEFTSKILDVHRMKFSPDCKMVVIQHSDRWEIRSLKTGESIYSCEGYIESIEFSPDSTMALIQHSDRWEIRSLKTRESIYSDKGYFKSIEFSKDSTMALIVDCDNIGKIMNLEDGRSIWYRPNVLKIKLSPDCKKAMVFYKCGEQTSLECIDLESTEWVKLTTKDHSCIRILKSIIDNYSSLKKGLDNFQRYRKDESQQRIKQFLRDPNILNTEMDKNLTFEEKVTRSRLLSYEYMNFKALKPTILLLICSAKDLKISLTPEDQIKFERLFPHIYFSPLIKIYNQLQNLIW